MKVYVTHYTPLTERKIHIDGESKKHGLDTEFIETEEGPGKFSKELTRTRVSVFRKHVEAWKRVSEGKDAMYLVLEDDAVLDTDFNVKFNNYVSQLPPDFDMLFVGEGCNMHINIPAGTIALKPETRCADSYVISPTCAQRMLRLVDDNEIWETVDHWMNKAINQLHLKVYWAEPTIVRQGTSPWVGLFKSSIN
jgi:GR25 family glycosyltransferase involved in LPS biosynthesis